MNVRGSVVQITLRAVARQYYRRSPNILTVVALRIPLVSSYEGNLFLNRKNVCRFSHSRGGGLLDSLAENATGQLTQAVESVQSQVVESATKSVAGVIEAGAESATQLVENIKKTAIETVKGGVTSCEETGNTINENLRKTTDSIDTVKQQVEADIADAKTAESVLIADIHKTASNLSSKADKFSGNLKGVEENTRRAVSDSSRRVADEVDSIRDELSQIVEHRTDGAKDSVKSSRKSVDEAIRDLKNAAQSTQNELNESSLRGLQDEIKTTTDILKKTVAELKSSTGSAIQQELALTLTTANAALREIVHDNTLGNVGKLQDEIKSTADILKNTVEKINVSGSSAIQQELAVTLTTASAALKEIVSSDTLNAASKAVKTMGGCATKGSADITGTENAVSDALNFSGKLTGGNERTLESPNTNFDLNQDNKEDMSDIVEAVVCQETDLKTGEMKEFPLGEDGNILLVKNGEGQFAALGTKCTHYGAPMVTGVLYRGGIRCPYHGACFNSTTGDIEESPGVDSLPCYKVSIENGQVKVAASKELLKQNKRVKVQACKSRQDPKVFVIIGGGPAGQTCAESLREEGFKGRIIILTAEDVRPYDRPKLSKAMNLTADEIALRNEVFYQNTDIEIWLNHEVSSVDIRKRLIKCANGASISYDKLLIATGGSPRKLHIPGSNLEKIYYLRTPDESNAILECGQGKNVVVYGSSFIGMEVAGFMSGRANSVTVVARSPVPFQNVFGDVIGKMYKTYFESKGVAFEAETEISEFRGINGKVTEVACKNGKVLPADVVIIGIGVIPGTGFLKDSGLLMNKDGLIPVNEYLQTSIDSIYAAGDTVEFPLTLYDNKRVHVAHWQMAQNHGRNAAKNMMGKAEKLSTVPFFWMRVLDSGIRYAGYCEDADDVVIQGDLDERKFAAYFCKGEDVVAVGDMVVYSAIHYAHYIQHGKTLTKADLKNHPDNSWFKALA